MVKTRTDITHPFKVFFLRMHCSSGTQFLSATSDVITIMEIFELDRCNGSGEPGHSHQALTASSTFKLPSPQKFVLRTSRFVCKDKTRGAANYKEQYNKWIGQMVVQDEPGKWVIEERTRSKMAHNTASLIFAYQNPKAENEFLSTTSLS